MKYLNKIVADLNFWGTKRINGKLTYVPLTVLQNRAVGTGRAERGGGPLPYMSVNPISTRGS